MRIDKFLKVSRLIKRRTLANEACEHGRVKINDKVAKPGSEIKVGDILEIHFGNSNVKIKINLVQEHMPKDTSKEMYTLLD